MIKCTYPLLLPLGVVEVSVAIGVQGDSVIL